MTRLVPGQYFSHVLCTRCNFSPLYVRQLGQYDPRDFYIIVGAPDQDRPG